MNPPMFGYFNIFISNNNAAQQWHLRYALVKNILTLLSVVKSFNFIVLFLQSLYDVGSETLKSEFREVLKMTVEIHMHELSDYKIFL